MSRLAKKSIPLPEKTDVTINPGEVKIKGPLGELSLIIDPRVEVVKDEEGLKLTLKEETIETLALWGTVASHLMNMFEGVTKGYTKKVVIDGIGYKGDVRGNEVVLAVGFSHPVKLTIPAGITVVGEKNTLAVSGIDKTKVGQFAASIRTQKKPEPYKGKGIRYEGEVIRRKQGKKSV
jgi:large subunit ribosomal protein L6